MVGSFLDAQSFTLFVFFPLATFFEVPLEADFFDFGVLVFFVLFGVAVFFTPALLVLLDGARFFDVFALATGAFTGAGCALMRALRRGPAQVPAIVAVDRVLDCNNDQLEDAKQYDRSSIREAYSI